MLPEEKEAFLNEFKMNIRKRSIFTVRNMLVDILTLCPDDADFLITCYDLVKNDSLIFQRHNYEILDYDVNHWSEEGYAKLKKTLEMNFSRKRYHLCLDLAIHFYELTQVVEEVEVEEELEEEDEKSKKKRQKREKKKREHRHHWKNDHEKYMLTGVGTTAILLLGMVIQLMVSGE